MAEQRQYTYGTPYKFNGKESDEETGLYYYSLSRPQDGRARYYDPRLSMWYGVDPLAEMYPGHTPFNYVLNNPIRLIDPTGMSPEDVDGKEGHITVNKIGEVTKVETMSGPNKFFDEETGEELVLNDPENNPHDAKLLDKKFEVGDQVYQILPSQDMWDLIVSAGFEPKKN